MYCLIRFFPLSLFLFTLITDVKGATTDTLYLDSSVMERRKVGIERYVRYYQDSTGRESFDEIYRKSRFLDINSFNPRGQTKGPVWAQLTVQNTGADTLNLIFFLGYHIINEMYISGIDTSQPPHGKPIEFIGLNDSFSVPLMLPPSRTVTCWVRSNPFLLFREFNPYLFSKAGYRTFKRSHTDSSQYSFGYRAMIMGLCFFLGLFAIVQSVYNKDPTYRYWGLYLWATFAYFLLGLDHQFKFSQKQNALLEEQRVQKITSDFEQRIARTEVAALRSQMNPHFIFNCLNSIKLYTMEHNAEAASGYLTKFARLIRLVLDNSRSEKITLEDELETLKLYAEMEVMRFKDKVTFELEVAPQLDTSFIEIPPLILQPFVENAIWHGLMHKIEGGWVNVKVSQNDGALLHIEITDNGVGRKKSQELKSKNSTLNKSFGIKVTSERIELINQMYRTETKCKVVDLYDEKGSPIGTQVVLEIPI
jgi:sensor histidine kinase YesM